MPSASQLTKVGSYRYTDRLPPLPAGKHTIKVYWANNTTAKPPGPVRSVTSSVWIHECPC
jgi:hypothetical protein